MSSKVVNVLFVISYYFVSNECASTRIYFSRCDYNGFSCYKGTNNKYNVTYQCPVYDSDKTLHLWQFSSPATTQSVVIKNCNHFRLSLQCMSSGGTSIIELKVVNVTNLYLLKNSVAHNPQHVIFENVTNLEYIPEGTFSQRRIAASGCSIPSSDFQFLHFNNVNIGTVAPRAFNDLKDFHNFSWNNVKVRRLQHLAVQVELSSSGNFSVENSYLEVCEHLTFKIIGRDVQFNRNEFVDVNSGAINGTIQHFFFTYNNINTLQPAALSILAETVHISNNKFEYLRAGAFERVGPGLIKDSKRNFGKLHFVYNFTRNSVAFMDAGSLNPDMGAYENVATSVIFKSNLFYCTCDNIGWIFSKIGYGHHTRQYAQFYQTITRAEWMNTCNNTSCDLLLQKTTSLVENGKCLNDTSAETLCNIDQLGTIKHTNVVDEVITFSQTGFKYLLNVYLLFLTTIVSFLHFY